MEYLNIPSVIRPVQHGDDLTVRQPPEGYQLQVDEGGYSGKEDMHEPSTSQDPDFVPRSEPVSYTHLDVYKRQTHTCLTK